MAAAHWILIRALIVAGCAQQSVPRDGTLAGSITIGPLCPVEQSPPDPNCQPTIETFKAWPIGVWNQDRSQRIAALTPDADGAFSQLLPEGTYVVDLKNHRALGGGDLPQTVTITSGKTTRLEISIDTGIR
jgi:hypothetical protein